jgi:integrase
VPKTSDTVAIAVSEWREHVAETLKPSSRRSAESHLPRHILPLLGECPLEDLTVKKMQTFVTTLASGQRRAKTIENVLLTLSSILSSARKWGYKVPTVALSDLSLPRKIKAQPRVDSAAEMARIVSSADEPLGTICFVLGSTGMRIGEVLALRIEDLDFQRRLAHIRLRFSRVLWAHQRVKRAWPRCRCRSIWRSVSRGSGFKALLPKRPRAPIRDSPRTPILCEQAAGNEAAPAAEFAGDSTRGLPCVSTWCRYDAY